jgi:hypothetical protein
MKYFGSPYLFILLACPGLLQAQGMKFIDLTNISQRTELRHPPAPPPECEKANCISGGSVGGSVVDGAPDWRDPRALDVSLLRISPTDIDPAKPFEVEFEARNTGTVAMDIPVSPHLSDLQPIDESVPFSYFSLQLVVAGEGELQGSKVSSSGFVELYGAADHPESMMVLKPGEWIRVRANVKLFYCPAESITMLFRGNFGLRKNTFKPSPGGEFTEVRNLYPNITPTPPITVHLLRTDSEQPRKQR